MQFRVAGFQMPVSDDIPANVDLLGAAIEQAAAAGAEVLLTPEGSLSGYRADFPAREVEAALERVTAAARRRGVGLALGTCFREGDGRCHNQLRFYRPDGTYLGFHSKTLLCAAVDRRPSDELNHFAQEALRTFEWAPGCRVGGLICNDLWAHPQWTPMPDLHLTQRLAEAGAQVIFHAVNGGRDGSDESEVNWRYHEANLRLRAAAGRVWIVTADNAAPTNLRTSAPSGVVDPRGRWACRAAASGLALFVHALELAEVGPAPIRPPEAR